MKFVVTKMAGSAAILVPETRPGRFSSVALLLPVLAVCGFAAAQTLYKYQDENGDWVYTDRKPGDEKKAEVRDLELSFEQPSFSVTHAVEGRSVDIMAHNEYYAPIEVRLKLDRVSGVSIPDPGRRLVWVVAPRSDMTLLTLQVLGEVEQAHVQYSVQYIPGDPNAVHRADTGYQAPFSIGVNFPVTQAYPDSITHNTRDSRHAIDVAMPIGTDVVAARGGVVFEVASNNFRSGTDRQKHGNSANIVRILHDDGTMSLYAHLNVNAIRVKPGDRVQAGQYIADSGNTGFSSGPHLHFAVHRNVGLSVESVPVVFRGYGAGEVVPATGDILTAYP